MTLNCAAYSSLRNEIPNEVKKKKDTFGIIYNEYSNYCTFYDFLKLSVLLVLVVKALPLRMDDILNLDTQHSSTSIKSW